MFSYFQYLCVILFKIQGLEDTLKASQLANGVGIRTWDSLESTELNGLLRAIFIKINKQANKELVNI